MNRQEMDKDGAVFSECRKYRYALFRQWDLNDPLIMFIGLNPSTANEHDDDPTIRRVISFAQKWGFGGVAMMNLFPLVSTDPNALLDFYNTPLHKNELTENDEWLRRIKQKCTEVCFAWGSFKQAQERAKDVIKMFDYATCLQINKDGSPKHPLYVKGTQERVCFK